MSSAEALGQLVEVPGLSSRLCSGAGLSRLRAEARLIRRYPQEYRRMLPIKGHVGAIQSLVRRHGRQYNGYLVAAVLEHDRLLGPPSDSAGRRLDTSMSRVPARAG